AELRGEVAVLPGLDHALARFRGQGPFADLLAQRFAVAMKRLGLDRREGFGLDCSRFAVPGAQMALF
ncbi:hypothetical protein ACLBWC_27995, partial [Pseudomonas aeruginosa]